MITGDNRKTAMAVAGQLGIDAYLAEVLPEDKAEYIRKEQSGGRTVVMIGDGINDTPAVSALLHNSSTLLLSMHCMTDLMEK